MCSWMKFLKELKLGGVRASKDKTKKLICHAACGIRLTQILHQSLRITQEIIRSSKLTENMIEILEKYVENDASIEEVKLNSDWEDH
jgi:hypothetical protein